MYKAEWVDIKERSLDLKIDSSTIGMESSRSYRESSVTLRRYTIASYEQETAEGNSALNTAVGSNTENAGESEADKTQQPAAELQDWQNRLRKAGSGVTVRGQVSQALADIRETTLRYIFDILFAGRRNRMKPWMQSSGYSGASSQGADRQGTYTQGAYAQGYSQSVYTQGTYMQGYAQGAYTQGTYAQGYSQGYALGYSQTAYTGRQKVQWNGAGSGEAVYDRVLSARPLITNMKVLTYSEHRIQIEAEDTEFSTVGTVRTADGREINFNVNVGMSREFQQSFREDLQLSAFKMCDPLVINLNTDVAELSDQTFYFDIDADGEMDEVSGLGSGSGYLALDKNGDGQINDGSELFGTASGNGFADLAAYDEDGNGWIDENDAIWDKLKIWCKDENGNDVLYRLADKGVGAICLQNVSTDYTLKGQEGQTKGAIRNTGIFLYENGNVGTVQHVDVAKYDSQA